MRVVVSKRALRQLDKVTEYFYAQSPRVGMAFEDALEQALNALEQFWKSEVKYENVRTYRVRPYHIRLHFRVDEKAGVLTIAAAYDERSLGRVRQ